MTKEVKKAGFRLERYIIKKSNIHFLHENVDKQTELTFDAFGVNDVKNKIFTLTLHINPRFKF